MNSPIYLNSKPPHLSKTFIPSGTNLISEKPSLEPMEASIAYDKTTKTLCIGNGSTWESLSFKDVTKVKIDEEDDSLYKTRFEK
jgi:hypothetical protein